MTERLYHADPYLTCFSARVVGRLVWDGQPAAVLDRTAFYPASGGQPADSGTLGTVAVLDVALREEDRAHIHVLERALEETEVEGEVDWARRFDHMQQHTGQHVLSAAFERVLNAETVGFHLGAKVSTVDIGMTEVSSEAATQVEELANQVIWDDRAVSARFVRSEDLAALPISRPPSVTGPVRVVEISDFDINPCGGTHVCRTGEIGLIKVTGVDDRGDTTRVEFLCGTRALHDYRAANEVIDRLVSRLTVGQWELDRAVERLQADGRQLRHDLRVTRRELLDVEADELEEGAVPRGPYRVVWRMWEHRKPEELRALARRLAERPGVLALLISVGERTHLCFARAEGLDLDVEALLRGTCGKLGGKGGGRPRAAQGSAPATDASRVEAVVSGLLSRLTSVPKAVTTAEDRVP